MKPKNTNLPKTSNMIEMNSDENTLSGIFSRHKLLFDSDQIFHFLNKKYKIGYHSIICRHFFDAGMKILETGSPLILQDIFGTNGSGKSYNLFYRFVEQGYFIKQTRGFILTDKGKLLMMEYISLVRAQDKKNRRISE